MPILPERLRLGDTVALVCPASAPADPGAIDQSVSALEALGFRVKLPRHARKRLGFLAGDDRERAEDLMRMFNNRRVNAIFCVRGGYGTGRLLSRLDYGIIRRNPKIFVGYSDITALHCAFRRKANLLSFHGPMPASDFIKPGFPAFTKGNCLRLLMEPHGYNSVCCGYRKKTVSIIRRGEVTAELVGGNLSILCSLLGTPYQPAFRGKILFLEDVDEPPYRLDRMLTHLLNAGVLQTVAGVAVGICTGCEDPKAREFHEYRQTADDVWRERLGPLNVPVVIGLPFGHTSYNATLPVGGVVRLRAKGENPDIIVERFVVK